MSLKREVDSILRDIENPEGASVYVKFDERPFYNEDESNKQGRPVYENRLFITKHKDSLSINVSKAGDDDIKMYPREYEAFKRVRQDREAGIPIGMLPAITPAQRATCEACRIYTVEKLAAADEQIMAVLRMPELKQRALEYLRKDDKVAVLEAEIAELKKKLGEKDEPINHVPKRRGRNAAVRASVSGSEQLQ
jgi:hypothetical protein